jgi:serine/threonine-protein phosphatase 2B regulatory subunit
MVMAILDEANLRLSDFAVEEIIDNVITKILLANHSIFRAVFVRFNMHVLFDCQTFNQADSNGDGMIDPKEWEEFVKKNPACLRNMSLPYLE